MAGKAPSIRVTSKSGTRIVIELRESRIWGIIWPYKPGRGSFIQPWESGSGSVIGSSKSGRRSDDERRDIRNGKYCQYPEYGYWGFIWPE